MASKYLIKETAPFVQFSSVKVTDAYNALFDIEKVTEETLETYCQALFTKAFNQNNSHIPDFLNHHCNLFKEPMVWLNKFEKLISENEEIFHEAKRDSKLIKFQTCIELKRQELKIEKSKEKTKRPPAREINAQSEDRYFSFKETKLKTHSLPTIQEKVFFLTTEIFEYSIAELELINNKLPDFEQECHKLIGKLQSYAKAKAEMQSALPSTPEGLLPYSKLRINCNVNQIVDIFYQLNREMFVDGKPFIDGNVQDIVAVIVNCFEDKGGLSLSPHTVHTILKPSKDDKRPNSGKRIDLNNKI